jgi:hypothetical protein
MKDLEKEFVPYELALRLKELDFNEPCFAFFNGKYHDWLIDDNNGLETPTINPNKDVGKCVKRPTFSQAFRWVREKYKLSHSIELVDNSRHYYYDFTIYDSKNRDYNDEDCFDSCKRIYDDRKFSNYEEAELTCLEKLIEILEQKQKEDANGI